MRRLLTGLLIAAASFAPLTTWAQSRPDEQARRLLDDGREYRQQGKLKQAIDNFNAIVTSFPGTTSVDDALIELGRYYMEELGDAEKARLSFEQVTKAYPQSDGAPGAYYWLGRLTLGRATTPAELDDALAQFNRVQRLYPHSEWVAQALYASGLVHRKAGRLAEAIEFYRRVVLEYPHSEAAPAAQFEIGRSFALLGEPRQAMEEFQQVRNRFPESPWPAHALDRITALYRLYGYGKPTFTLDPSYNAAAGDVMKDVSSILMLPNGTLWIASGKTKGATPIGPDGKLGTPVPFEDPRSLSTSPKGDVLVVGRAAVHLGPKELKTFAVPGVKPGEMETLDKIACAVMLPGGGMLVSDEKKRRVYRYDEQYRYVGAFPDVKDREVTRIGFDGEGGIVLLDDMDKSVRVFDVVGRPLRAIGSRGTGYEMKKPVDFAIDAFRNTYVADADGAVWVFGGQGQLLTTLSGELRRPRALTLDADGAVLVYDEKAERILRYR